MLSGLGSLTYALYAKVETIETKQTDSIQYIILIKQLRKEVDDHERRLRALENEYAMHSLDEFNTVTANSLQPE